MWKSLCSDDNIPINANTQDAWDLPFIHNEFKIFSNGSLSTKARILATSILLSWNFDESSEIASGIRLGAVICERCEPYTCICGYPLDKFGTHGLSCIKKKGTFSRHIAEHEICGVEGSDPYENGTIRRYNAFTGGAWIVYEYTAGFEFIPVVVGIHQYQIANRTASFGHATRVSPFVEWIETLVGELIAK